MKNVIVSLRRLSVDETERRLAEAREKERRARMGARLYGEEIGQARGEEIGQARGLALEKQETARRMKEKDYPVDEIVGITGLTIDEIDAL